MVAKISATLTLFACCISGGILGLPSIFASLSVAEAFSLTFISYLTTMFSLMCLVTTSGVHPEITTYGNLVRWLGGETFERVVDLVLGLFLSGVLGGSFIIIRDFAVDNFSTTGLADAATALSACLVCALAMPESIGKLAAASTFSVASFCFLVVTLVYYGVEALNDGNSVSDWDDYTASDDDTSGDERDTFSLKKMATSLPPIIYAFGCQIQIFSIFYSVEDSRASISSRGGVGGLVSFLPVIIGACTLMIICFGCVGFFGVLSFPGKKIDGDVLNMLNDKGKNLGHAARGLLVFAVMLAAALIVFPARNCLFSTFMHMLEKEGVGGEETASSPREQTIRCLMTFLVCAISSTLAISQISFLSLLTILGAFVAAPLMIVLPGVALLKLLLLEDNEDEEDRNDREKGLLAVDIYSDKHKLSSKFRIFSVFIASWCVVVGCVVFGANLTLILK